MPTSILAIERLEAGWPNENSPSIIFAALGAIGVLAARVGDKAKAESALKRAVDVQTPSARQLAVRGLLLGELDLIRAGRLESAEERALAGQLADAVVPERGQYALAA